MMKAFARFTISGQFPAFAVVFGFSLLTLIFQLVVISPGLSLVSALISGSAIVLIALHTNPKYALLLAVVCALAIGACSHLLIGSAAPGISATIALIFPSLLLATIFISTKSLSFSLQIATLLGVLVFFTLTFLFPDLNQTWENILRPAMEPLLKGADFSNEQAQLLIERSAQLMNGALIALTLVLHGSALLLGRWWHCLAIESNEFQENLSSLRLGKVLAIAAIVMALWATIANSTLLSQLSLIVIVLFTLQGLAVIHTTATKMTKGKTWLIITYVLIFLVTPPMLVLIMLLGLTDTFINIRKRV